MRRSAIGLLLLLAAAVWVTAGAPVAAEEPLETLVRYPPHQTENRRGPYGNDEFYIDQAGVAARDIVAGESVVGGRGEGGITAIRGTRFASKELAETAALTLAARDIGPVHDLGSMGEGWIVTIEGDVADRSGLFVHDGFRLRGRDIFSFMITSTDGTLPPELPEVMRWHAEAFPGGSELAVPAPGGSIAYRIGRYTGIAVLVSLFALLLARRRQRRTDRRPAAGPPSAGGPAGDPGRSLPQARVVW